MEVASRIFFADERVKKAYESLKKNRQEQLKEWLDRAFSDLERNAFCGTQIAKRLIPKEYKKRFEKLDNLWKYNLPSAWRLLYTVKRDRIIVLSIVLEWLSHKDYEKRFKY